MVNLSPDWNDAVYVIRDGGRSLAQDIRHLTSAEARSILQSIAEMTNLLLTQLAARESSCCTTSAAHRCGNHPMPP